jgi:hypothetical protein
MCRYFIVVDDIWDVKTWDVIKGAFPINISKEKENNFGKRIDNSRKEFNNSRKRVNKYGKEFNNSGSIIITTTRINNVGRSCCSSFDGHIYKIRHLDMVHSRQLFHRRLFNSEENCPSYLKEVSEQILEKCDGLPLAIIAVSGLLANTEEEEHLWNQVKDSIGRALERNATVEVMMKILSLSYYDLPAHLKTCVLYLSMYQEDSIIEKKGLIGRWIGEGFIHKEGRYTTKELGERYFNDLLNRSLIQPERTNRYGKLKSCRVHDTVLDFIISKSIEENFITLVGVPNLTIGSQGKVRRLSLQVDQQENSVLPTRLVLSHVRSLGVPSGWKEIPSLHEFRHLRVLHFEISFQLENRHCAGIGRLLQLRYLNLRWMSELSELPEQIGNLVCLEMLDIRGTGIHELPSTIVNLGKLVDLLVEGHVKFPDRMGKMQSLEVLKRVSVFQKPPNFFVELGLLKNLRKLVLYFPVGYITGVAAECKKVVFTSLHSLGTMNLRSLKIISHSIGAVGRSFLEEPPLRLRKIRAHNSAFQRVPNWVGSLVNLQHLCLQVRGVGQEDMCILGRLRALLILDLQGIQENSGDKRLTISGGVGFRCLRRFLYETYDGMDLVFATGSMPELRKLQITFDADQTEFLYATLSFNFGIKNLPCLDAITCDINSCCTETVEAAKSALERAVNTHPNRPTLLYI